MAKGKLMLICQSGGEFITKDDGTLSYEGSEANAVNIHHESMFDDLNLKLAEMCNLDQNTISIKYFLPGNRRNLITLRNDKDLDYHGNVESSSPGQTCAASPVSSGHCADRDSDYMFCG